MSLAGGAIGSPQLPLLSGVGPADELRKLGIGLRAHAPARAAPDLQFHLLPVDSEQVSSAATPTRPPS